jgi:hypothetical protein
MNRLIFNGGASVSGWHLSDMSERPLFVRLWEKSGKHRLNGSISHFGPHRTSDVQCNRLLGYRIAGVLAD